MQKHRILFTFQAPQFVIESGSLPFEAAAQGHEVHVALYWNDSVAQAYENKCRAQGLHVRNYSTQLGFGTEAGTVASAPVDYPSNRQPFTTRARAALSRLLPRSSPLRRFISLPDYLRTSLAAREIARKTWAWSKPDIYFSASFGSIIGVENHLAKVTRQAGAKLFCYPTYPCYGEDVYIRRRFQNVDMGMWTNYLRADADIVNRLLAKAFPNWTRTYNGKTQFAKDPIEMLAARLLGLLYHDPWKKPYDIYDRIYVPYQFSADLLYRNGYRHESVGMLGKPSIDQVARQCADPGFVSQMQEELGFTLDESFILFNVAPSAEHKNTSEEVHFRQFFAICDVLKATGEKIILSLHPLCNFETYNRYAARYGFTISRNYQIYYLQPFCRFIVSHSCTTNHQGALVGKKVIDIDYLNLRFEDLSMIAPEEIHPNIMLVPPEELAKTVDRLLAETANSGHDAHSYYTAYAPAGAGIVKDAVAFAAPAVHKKA